MAYIGNSPTEQLYTAFAEKYSGNGSNTTFDLSRSVGSVNDIEVVVAGSQKNPFTEYSLSANGVQLIFSSAPGAGTDNIVVSYRNYVVTTFIPEDNTITSGMLQANAVTTTKIADNSITSAKIAPGTVIAADILDGSVDNNKLVSANITGDKLVANTITTREIADGAIFQNNITDGAVTTSKLSASGVAAGVYGGTIGTSSNVASITVDSTGRITSASNVAIDTGFNPFLLAGL